MENAAQQLENAGQDEEFLTVNEVAAKLKLNPQTLRNWIDQGRLRAIRVGPRRVRIRKSDLDEFLASADSVVEPDHAVAAVRSELRRAVDSAMRASRKADRAEMIATLHGLADAVSALAQRLADEEEPDEAHTGSDDALDDRALAFDERR